MKAQLEQCRIFDAPSSFNLILKYKSSIKPKFNGVYSKNDQPKVKDGVYAINLDEFKSIGTH